MSIEVLYILKKLLYLPETNFMATPLVSLDPKLQHRRWPSNPYKERHVACKLKIKYLNIFYDLHS